jgi:hypothetical protein
VGADQPILVPVDEAGFEQAVEAALDVGPFDRQVGIVEDVAEFLAQDGGKTAKTVYNPSCREFSDGLSDFCDR